LERAPIISKRKVQKRNTWLLTFEVDVAHAARIAGVRHLKTQQVPRLQEDTIEFKNVPSIISVEKSSLEDLDTVVCRCERITLREIVDFIKKNDVKDANQLKSLRVGMGACGGKTCSQLIAKAFIIAGVNPAEIEPFTQRPLFMEVPMGSLVNEGLHKLGGKDAGTRGAP